VNPAFWRERRVFITGHTGFKGSWLTLWLDRLGAKVVGYALAPTTAPTLFDLAGVDSRVQSVFADVRDLDRVRSAVRDTRPEIIFHMAAQSLVRESYRSPIDTFATNIMGTANLLESARLADTVLAVVVVTSDKCYENREQKAGYRETDPMGGHDPYSSSKGAAELVASSYRRSFFKTTDSAMIATARAGNVIGGGDFALDRLIPDCVRAVENGTPVSIRHAESTRPWQFVLEPLAAYLTLAERLVADGHEYAEAWNFGPGDEEMISVRDLCERFASVIADRSGTHLAIQSAVVQAPEHEAKLLRLDSSKARQRLRCRPVLTVGDAIAMTASWYAEYLNGGNLAAMTIAQLDEFQTLAQHAYV
jgi:CDP-glucose 4,6-dehydratase